MGIQGRDYYRESSKYTDRLTGWGWIAIPPVCKWIIIINVVTFLLQIFITRPIRRGDLERTGAPIASDDESDDGAGIGPFMPRVSVVQDWAQLETDKVLHGQVWRLLTHAFCHDRTGIWHLLFNMVFFYWFGPTLESMYGSREFLLFYLTAAVVAGLAYVGLDLITHSSVPAIGASGAVMAVTMLYAIHYPRTVIYIMMIIPLEVRWLVALYVIFDLHPVLLALAGDRMFTGVAHAAHLGGLAFGYVYWKFNWRLEPLVASLRRPNWSRMTASRRGIRVYHPEHEPEREREPEPEPQIDPSDAAVDDILRKIREHGESSLTQLERQTLIAASERYKNRHR
jgi:membrane associated rhomboid family serine protease